jgi:hypothetical protein
MVGVTGGGTPQEITYQQDAEPGDPSVKETWLDGAGILRIYADLGTGEDWHTVPPVQVREEVTSFSESGLSINPTDARVWNESIEMFAVAAGATTTRTSDNDVINSQTNRGLVISPNSDLEGVRAKISANTNPPDEARLEVKGGETLQTKDVSGKSSGGVVEFTEPLSGGTEYNVFLSDSSGNSWDQGFRNVSTSEYPYTGTDIDITASYSGGSETQSYVYVFSEMTSLVEDDTLTAGESVVSFNTNPADLESWDLVSYADSPDGETVTVDVEDSNGNVLFSDIPRNFDISTVDPSVNPQFHVYLSRSDTSNEPRLDYLVRRFTR